MSFARPLYRLRQFSAALSAKPTPEDLNQVASWLSPRELALFAGLQPSEQAHSLEIFKRLQAEPGDLARQPELLVAALLHDVGKSRYPLRPWERVWIVLAQALFPRWVQRWGWPDGGEDPEQALQAPRWRRPLILAGLHPAWGAAMAATAGSAPLVVALIRRHQNLVPGEGVSLEERLLKALQRVDGAM